MQFKVLHRGGLKIRLKPPTDSIEITRKSFKRVDLKNKNNNSSNKNNTKTNVRDSRRYVKSKIKAKIQFEQAAT